VYILRLSGYKNKIVVGHSKAAIYLSNLIVGFTEGLILIFAWIISMVTIGMPLIGRFTNAPVVVLTFLLVSILMTFSYVSIFTLLCMLNQNKAGAAVSAILVFILILFLGSYCKVRLGEPEMHSPGPTYSVFDADTQTITETSPLEPNPAYLSGNQRKFYEFAGDFLPSAQGIQLSMMRDANLLMMSVYSLLIVIGTTTLGVLFFRKKDLK
jgi:ABC-type transport system involved in multi-copper enzyme maturation permease subunit